MCTNPRLIRNPWLNVKSGVDAKKDTSSLYIPIPCGHCPECVSNRALGVLQRCELEELSGHPFMIMLTYSNEVIPRVKTSLGRIIKYADYKDVSNMFKRLRASNAIGRKFRYLCVSERGHAKGRPHFHILLYLEKFKDDNSYTVLNLEDTLYHSVLNEWRRNVAKTVNKSGKIVSDTRNPKYVPLCNYVEFTRFGKKFSNYGCHYVVPSSLNGSTLGATNYVLKYFLKADPHSSRLQSWLKLNLPSDEYKDVWNKVRPGCWSSLNFGFGLYDDYNPRKVSKSDRLVMLSKLDTFKHVLESISRSVDVQESPKYYKLDDGKSIPLSRYFYHFENLYTVDVYNYFKDLGNKFGDFVQIDDRDILYRLQIESSKVRKLSHGFIKQDITDLF